MSLSHLKNTFKFPKNLIETKTVGLWVYTMCQETLTLSFFCSESIGFDPSEGRAGGGEQQVRPSKY